MHAGTPSMRTCETSGPSNCDAVAQVVAELRRYLAAHPDAADSLAGVLKWWLPRQRYEETAEIVREALERLAEEGVVSRRAQPGGSLVYMSARRSESLSG
jgi:hypothetical protein